MSQIFLSSWWMGSIAPWGIHFFRPLLLPAALLVLYLNHLQLFYDEGCIPAHLEVECALPRGQGPGRMSFSQEEEWNLSVMQTRQEGKEGNSGYSQKDCKTMKSEPDKFPSATEVICLQFGDLVSNHRADRTRACTGPHTLWALKVVTDTEGFIRQSDGASFLGRPLTWVMFFVSLVSHLPQT